MKKFFTMTLLLFTVISIAVAQPAMMTKGETNNLVQNDNCPSILMMDDRDPIQVEIITNSGYHYPNDSSLICPLLWTDFHTNEQFSWYTWETSLDDENYIISEDQTEFSGNILESCYIKVTVGDDNGNTGQDSIYFNVKDWITPPDSFEMKVIDFNGNLNPNISFTANSDNTCLFIYFTHNYTDWGYFESPLDPGMYINRTFDEYSYNTDTVWNLLVDIPDSCWMNHYKLLPGMYLNEREDDNDYYLDFKTRLPSEGDELIYQLIGYEEYVYQLFTVDTNDIRYPLTINGEQIILPSSTETYKITLPNENQYYQCAVAKVINDNEFKILSYSNKVENPWIGTVNIDENHEYDVQSSVKVYPNPAHGCIIIEGTGMMHVSNVLGQVIMAKAIDGKETVALPKGLYFVQMNGAVRKIVVE